MSLTTLVLLPFIGSLLAAVPPTRGTPSPRLAGLVAVFCAIQAALYFPDIANGGVLRFSTLNGFPSWAEPDAEAGRVCLDVLLAGSGVGSLVVLYAR